METLQELTSKETRRLFGERISNRLEEMRISQREMATKVGVTDVTFSRWVSGERAPSEEKLKELSTLINVSYEELYNLLTNKEIIRMENTKPHTTERSRWLFGERIKKRLTEKKMSYMELGFKINAVSAMICRWVDGESVPTLWRLKQLSEALDIPYEELYNLISDEES